MPVFKASLPQGAGLNEIGVPFMLSLLLAVLKTLLEIDATSRRSGEMTHITFYSGLQVTDDKIKHSKLHKILLRGE